MSFCKTLVIDLLRELSLLFTFIPTTLYYLSEGFVLLGAK